MFGILLGRALAVLFCRCPKKEYKVLSINKIQATCTRCGKGEILGTKEYLKRKKGGSLFFK